MISLHFALRQRDHFTYRLVDVERIFLRWSFFSQGANSSDDVAHSLSVIHHKGNRIPRFFQVFCIEPAQTGAGIVDECAERLIDFMGNRGTHLSQRRHPRDVSQFDLRFAKRFFGALAIFDLHRDSVPLEDISLLITKRHRTSQKPAVFPIRRAPGCLIFERRAGSHGPSPLVQKSINVFGVNRAPNGVSSDKPECFAAVSTHEINGAVGQSGPNTDRNGFDQIPKFLLATEDCFLGPFPLRHVHRRADVFDEIAGFSENRMADDVNVSHCSIGQYNTVIFDELPFLTELFLTVLSDPVAILWVDSIPLDKSRCVEVPLLPASFPRYRYLSHTI